MKTESPIKTEEISIKAITPSPYQRRKVFDKEEIKSLALNIEATTLLNPVTVRELSPGKYELIAGEKRLRAFKELKRETIPATVRIMTDAEAATACAVENLHRSGLTPLEEADSIAQALGTMTREEVAEAFGKSVSWIAKRSNILNLSPEWKKAVKNGFAMNWPAAHLEVIARLPHETQDRLRTEDYENRSTPPALEDLKENAARELRSLAGAPWPKDEGEKPCSKCFEQTGADNSLFDDIKPNKAGKCLNKICWTAKMKQHVEEEIEKAKAKTPDIIKLDFTEPREDRIFDYGDPVTKSAWSKWEVKQVKETSPGAVPAIIVQGKNAGKTIYIEKPELREGRKQETPEGPKTMEQKREGLEKRRTILFIKKVMEQIELIFTGKIGVEQQKLDTAINLVCRFGAASASKELRYCGMAADPFSEEIECVPHVSSLIICTLPHIYKHLLSMTQWRNPDKSQVVKICEWILIDQAPIEQAVLEEIKEPKSWAKEEKFA